MRYLILLLVAISLIMTAGPASSHQREVWGGNVDIRIVSERGEDFHTIPYRDIRRGKTHVLKRYLEARRGETYSILIRNNMPERIGVVIAVDGRNVISGKKSHLRNNERMYIIDAYGYAQYQGWRTDDNTVHRFYFTDVDNSYTMRTFGDSSAMGVIAVSVFKEKKKPEFLPEHRKHEKGSRAPSGKPFGPGESETSRNDAAGTGFGDSTYSPVVKVQFNPGRSPFQKTLIKYAWRDVLCGKGILKCWPEARNRLWDEDEYAPYPPTY